MGGVFFFFFCGVGVERREVEPPFFFSRRSSSSSSSRRLRNVEIVSPSISLFPSLHSRPFSLLPHRKRRTVQSFRTNWMPWPG